MYLCLLFIFFLLKRGDKRGIFLDITGDHPLFFFFTTYIIKVERATKFRIKVEDPGVMFDGGMIIKSITKH